MSRINEKGMQLLCRGVKNELFRKPESSELALLIYARLVIIHPCRDSFVQIVFFTNMDQKLAPDTGKLP